MPNRWGMKYRAFVDDPELGTFWIIADDETRQWVTDPPGKEVPAALIGLSFQTYQGTAGPEFDIFPDGSAWNWD